MLSAHIATVQELASFFANLFAILFYLTVFLTYVVWRFFNARGGEGVQALYFVPPSISSKWLWPKEGFENNEKRSEFVIPVISCTLLNPDIFSETLKDVSLTIMNLDTSKSFKTKVFWVSESENPFKEKDNVIKINGGGMFGYKIISRGAEKRFNFYFLAPEGDSFALGNFVPGVYRAVLRFKRKKIWTRTVTIHMEFNVLKEIYADFMIKNSIATFLPSIPSPGSNLRFLPSKRWYQFLKRFKRMLDAMNLFVRSHR